MSNSEANASAENDFDIRRHRSMEETKSIWWPFMQKLNWNRCWYDLESYVNHSLSNGLLLVFPKSLDKPVGHVGAIINTNSTGWVTMFIVDDAYQGKGLGRMLFQAGMEDFKLHGTQTVGLDGVVQQKQTYERRGFVKSKLGVVMLMSRSLISQQPMASSHARSGQVQGTLLDLKKVPQPLLVAHELKYTGFERKDLWTEENMFKRPDVRGFALVSSDNPQSVDDLLAWAMIRRCSGGCRIGPLYADNLDSARSVLVAAMEACDVQYIKTIPLPTEAMNDWSEDKIGTEASMVMEVWTGNSASVKLVEDLGWKELGFYNRMWLHGKATPEQSEGGAAARGLYAVFDAAIG